jgi:hypothetical protein
MELVGRESRSVVRRTIEAQSLGQLLYFTALIVSVLFLALLYVSSPSLHLLSRSATCIPRAP